MARYAFSDLHGRLDIFKKICNFIKPEDELYCLGDCGDRGPHSWETIKAVLTHPQVVTYLKGNHEDMLVKAYLNNKKYDMNTDDYYLLCYNGGVDTYMGLMMEQEMAMSWVSKLKTLPTIASIMNENGKLVIMSHAGYTPGGEIPSPEDIIWNRDHFYEPWPEGFDDTVIVHGHTPISYLKEDGIIKFQKGVGDILAYDDGHKIDIDTGAVHTGVAVLLNLDTFEIHRIYGDEWAYLHDSEEDK